MSISERVNVSDSAVELQPLSRRGGRGMDFIETFAPVVRYDSLRVLLAIVAEEDLEPTQFNVQTSFMHGRLDEEIFMEIPEGLSVGKSSDGVRKGVMCRLNRSLYGLKQAPKRLNKKFSAFLRGFDFKAM